MKKVYAFLLGISLLSTAVSATPRHHRRQSVASEKEVGEPAGYSSRVEVRALQLACFFTDVLRLSQQQAIAVRAITLTKLMQLNNATVSAEPVLQQYDAAMLRILTPGQYSTFRWLEDRQPAAELLQPSREMVAQH